ncbi:MAG TPA: hypothetical protein VGS61_00025 [Acidimicrobiales bacterium]|nr:hypothetical protein [Acidimicrobiales bacterium]
MVASRVARGGLAGLALALAIATGPAAASPTTTTTVNPGSLPQTRAEPAFGSALSSQMTTLWRAIVTDNSALGRRVFFPQAAYIRMKTGLLASPSGDYADRLLAFYGLDLGADHRLIAGHDPRLLRVDYDRADAQWIAPRDCENLIGYWHLPGARLVYSRAGAVYSVAVFSLISWRGVWYVVHLGPNPRPVDAGMVAGYARGPGTPGPAGGC